ncbi:hypothetical protein PHISP_05042 [Aspergillus sp. HF37]|nr:hypothetical protein PHISP_05042 [Aspergillus sp. HF37]
MTDSNGTTAPRQSTGLTVDKMLAIYPREHVEDAIYDRNYEAGRNRTLQRFKDLIAQGVNVESCTKGIQEVMQTTPPSPPVDPDEPNDLDPDVLWRIKMLKYAYREDCDHDPGQLVNLNAVLDAYHRRDLKVVDNEATVWFAGKLTMGPLPDAELKIADYVDKIPAWREKYGAGRVWIERPAKRHIQKLNSTVIPPSDGRLQDVP